MTLDEAVKLATHVTKAREIAGQYVDVPYSQVQLVDAIIALAGPLGERPVSREEYNHAIRQVTASNARNAKFERTTGAAKGSA